MSVTDELREFMDGADGYELWCPRHKTELAAIADRIDAKHERAEQDLIDANKLIAKLGTNVAREYVKLPVDADGECIRVGDKLDGYGETTVVKELTLGDDGWSMTCGNGLWFDFAAFTHHHEPTVKDVLREMAIDWDCAADGEDKEAVLKEYAAKFRLANDGEEQ